MSLDAAALAKLRQMVEQMQRERSPATMFPGAVIVSIACCELLPLLDLAERGLTLSHHVHIGQQLGALMERAAIVAWLRKTGTFSAAADSIERGALDMP